MEYKNITEGIFIDRPNRFIANVKIGTSTEKVHVKNTGRCKELLIPGRKVFLQKSDNPLRKTNYSLISVYKNNVLVNIDSQVPNKVVMEAIENNAIEDFTEYKYISKEKTYKNSRFDIYLETANKNIFIEVKGVTLEKHGRAMFPDAPTKRGTKHINELIQAKKEGYASYIFFLIQMNNTLSFTPNYKTDPKFSYTLKKAYEMGVNIIIYDAEVTRNKIEIGKRIPLKF